MQLLSFAVCVAMQRSANCSGMGGSIAQKKRVSFNLRPRR